MERRADKQATAIVISIDYETYSEAGYTWAGARWESVQPPKNGLAAVGSYNYSVHPSTRVLCLVYDTNIWAPGMPNPESLFSRVAAGETLHAWNCLFEYRVWNNVCVPRYGWPRVPLDQFRDTMDTARFYGLPGTLEKAGEMIESRFKKLKDGARLINKFSVPKAPTKKHPYRYRTPETDPVDGPKLYQYCMYDVATEKSISDVIPPMPPQEEKLAALIRKTNEIGVSIDVETLNGAVRVYHGVESMHTAEIQRITSGAVGTAFERDKILGFMATRGVFSDSLDKNAVQDVLNRDNVPDSVRSVLKIRQDLSSASAKKIFTMKNQLCPDGTCKDILAASGAEQTQRLAGRGIQVQNLPRSGPKLGTCALLHEFSADYTECPHCGFPKISTKKWDVESVESAVPVIRTGDAGYVKKIYGDPLSIISGCLRGMLVSAPGTDFISSDYNSIEAVGLAMIAGEQWRIDVFRSHGKIYEMSASKISGVPLDEIFAHKKRTGEHHPLRNSIGKIAELAGGFAGSLGAYINFGADKHITPEQRDMARDQRNDWHYRRYNTLSVPQVNAIMRVVRAWRDASPAIVDLWYGLENAAKAAMLNPGDRFACRGIGYILRDDTLCCQLHSGRYLHYHHARIIASKTPWGSDTSVIRYKRRSAQGSNIIDSDLSVMQIVENVVQAECRDILVHALLNLNDAGYLPLFSVHDEPITQVPEGFGSVEEVERIMMSLPEWAKDWPIRASGGWRGKRFRK